MSFTLEDLDERLRQRAAASPDESYTARLLTAGTGKCARKFGEEAIEAIVAATTGDRDGLTSEAADVLYHLLVLLRAEGVPLAGVMEQLAARTAQSGLEEKAARGKGGS